MSPLGRYSDIITALVTAFLVVSAVLAHVFATTNDVTFLDAAATLGLGALYGKQSAANGYAQEARAAHRRLDAINAPPADDGTEPVA